MLRTMGQGPELKPPHLPDTSGPLGLNREGCPSCPQPVSLPRRSYAETMSGTLAVEAVNVSTTFGAAFIGLVVGSM